MAGDWIKFEVGTPEKYEVMAITAEMGWDDPDLTVGKLLRVWRWFDQQTLDGNARGVSAALLDRIVLVPGFAKAMETVGWLVIYEGGISLPNFGRHNGETAKSRALTAKRVAKHKANAAANVEDNAQSNEEGNDECVTSALPREEKRREEEKQKADRPSEKISLGDDGKWSGIPEKLSTSWHEAYPAVNVPAELAKAAAWVIANPKNRKSNYARFLTNWLTRAQDTAKPVRVANGSSSGEYCNPGDKRYVN